jgi:predicted nuclease of restriction endonuclease-like RecB superfamily
MDVSRSKKNLTPYANDCLMYEGGERMPLLQVRECPEDIYRKISNIAKKQNRTIAQQIIVLLEKGLGQTEPNIERRRQLLAKINARKISKKVQGIDAVALIREDRDR